MPQLAAWSSDQKPIYNITKSYEYNSVHGPFFDEQLPEREFLPRDQWIDFLGVKVASPLGVPAGPLLNSKWTTLAARLGFDIVTYKTIRSREKQAHPVPNIIYLDAHEKLDDPTEKIVEKITQPKLKEDIAITNSFGMGCPGPDYLLEDIARAKSELADGRVLIVSVVGTPREGENFVDDFARAAAIAKEAGAEIIEANFSCPNVGKSTEGSIYHDPSSVEEIASRVVKEIGDLPLIVKVGWYEDEAKMKEVLTAAARAGARAVCGINTVGRKVVKADGSSALGPTRETSGVCGGPIRKFALDFLGKARKIIDEEKLDLTLMGVGGAIEAEHFDQFLDAGAEVAMSATGMMWDPYLAMRWHGKNNK